MIKYKQILKIVLIVFTILNVSSLSAQDITEFYNAIPDTVLPYRDIPQFCSNTNKDSVFISKDKRMLRHIISDEVMIEIGKLDSVFILLKTISTPEKETICKIYNNKWQLIHEVSLQDLIEATKNQTDEPVTIEAHFADNSPEDIDIICHNYNLAYNLEDYKKDTTNTPKELKNAKKRIKSYDLFVKSDLNH